MVRSRILEAERGDGFWRVRTVGEAGDWLLQSTWCSEKRKPGERPPAPPPNNGRATTFGGRPRASRIVRVRRLDLPADLCGHANISSDWSKPPLKIGPR